MLSECGLLWGSVYSQVRPSECRLTNDDAVCWFKSTAHECIAKLRDAVSILEQYDIAIQMLTTDKPGYIVYEDEFQVAAVPFRREG